MEPRQGEPSAAAAAAAAGAAKCESKDWSAKVDVLMLLRSVPGAALGAAGAAAAPSRPGWALRGQLKQQLAEYSAAACTGQETFPDHITGEEFLRNAIRDLEKDMEELKVSFQNKTLALQRIQLAGALRNKVQQNDNDSRLIMETMTEIVMLSTSIIESQEQAREKEQKLNDIRKKRLSLKNAARQKLLQIHTMMKKQKEEETSKKVSKMLEGIRNDLQKERNITTLVQNIFQSIIIGSKVNWAEDPSLKAIVLQLEKNA
ncbi:centromere protein H [Leptosomus discolor]